MAQPIKTSPQFGQILNARRRSLKLSQTQLAHRLGLSQSRVSQLLNGYGPMTLDQMLIMASALGLEIVAEEKHAAATKKTEW